MVYHNDDIFVGGGKKLRRSIGKVKSFVKATIPEEGINLTTESGKTISISRSGVDINTANKNLVSPEAAGIVDFFQKYWLWIAGGAAAFLILKKRR